MKRTPFVILSIAAALLLVAGPSPSTDRAPDRRTPPLAAAAWSPLVNISPNLYNYNAEARVVTDASGLKAYVVWEESRGGPKKVHFTTNETGAWTSTENITVHELGEYPGPEIALDNNGNPLVVYQTRIGGNYEIVFRERLNGVWSEAVNASATPKGGSQSASILVDRATNDFYIIWQDDFERPQDAAVYWMGYLTYREKGVGSWIFSGVIAEPTHRCYFHVADIDAKGRTYTTFDNRSSVKGAVIQFAQNATPKNHKTWTRPSRVSDFTDLSFAYSKIAVDNEGNVYVVWTQNVEKNMVDNSEVFFRKRIKGVWRPVENLSNSSAPSTNPTVAVNKLTGQVHVAWSEQTGATEGVKEIFFRETAGAGWTTVRNMSQDAGFSDYPSLFVDRVGGVHLVFTDDRTGSYQIYYTNRRGEGLCFPPVNLAAVSRTTEDPRKKTTTLTWEANPENDANSIINYRVYRKVLGAEDSTLKLLATLDDKVLQYKDENLVGVERFTYKVSAVAKGDHESVDFAVADDQFIHPPFFPPVDLAVVSDLGETISLKTNALTWQKDVRNRDDEIAKYRIYRKQAAEDDAAYVLAAEVDPTVFRFDDAGLVNSQQYAYLAASYSIYGYESERGAAVTDRTVFAVTYPPASPVLATEFDTAAGSKTNILTWRDDARNAGLPIVASRVYRRDEGAAAFAPVATVGVDTKRYGDYNLPTTAKYVYRLVSVPAWDIESAPTGELSEARVFPPISITFQKAVNSFLLHKEEVNRLAWARNPLNDATAVASYKIYRRNVADQESKLAVVATVEGSVFEYQDKKSSPADKFVYRIRAVDGAGNESAISALYGEY
ncbi:MAG: hypothetical protein JW742_08580 [Candidatus Aminicenantes bacterium]|nr:hypothetical protein [Candidatus Aminicenantes bacterium]